MSQVFVIGIAGARGVGKSSLAGELLLLWSGPKQYIVFSKAVKIVLAEAGNDIGEDGDCLIVIDDVRLRHEAEWLRQFCAERGYSYRLVRVVASQELGVQRLSKDNAQPAGEADSTEVEFFRTEADWTVCNTAAPIALMDVACLIICDIVGVQL